MILLYSKIMEVIPHRPGRLFDWNAVLWDFNLTLLYQYKRNFWFWFLRAVVFRHNLKYLHAKLQTFCGSESCKQIIAWFVRDIWHKYRSLFKIVSIFTRLTAREIAYNNFEISPVVFMPNTLQIMLLPILTGIIMWLNNNWQTQCFPFPLPYPNSPFLRGCHNIYNVRLTADPEYIGIIIPFWETAHLPLP